MGTVCGYSKRLRLDLTVNILTNNAINKKKITIFGGEQKRPNIHIDDMVRAYIEVLEKDTNKVNGKIFNVGYNNYTISQISGIVKREIGEEIEIVKKNTF